MRATKYCGFGFGSDALATLCDYLHQRYGVTNFVISPSREGINKRSPHIKNAALNAYQNQAKKFKKRFWNKCMC
jgi:hypothetical protein